MIDRTNPRNFILIGRSGSGKGTQADLLNKKFPNLVHISTGEQMRILAQMDTEAGIKVKGILDDGGLLFDDLATAIWMHEIAYKVKPGQGLVCDGFPRRLVEAQNLDRFLEWLGRKENTLILHIEISYDEAFDRLKKRAREDDNDQDIKTRLDWFEENVIQVINYYELQGRLIKINGQQAIEKVFDEINSHIV